MQRWEHFPHQADIGVRGIADDVEHAFEQAATALIAVISPIERIVPDTAVEIECEAPDIELLLVDWLNALIFEMATRVMLFRRFEVHIHGQRLRAVAWGERINRARHRPAVEVKGATYTELRVTRTAQGWIAQCVVDV